MMTFTRYFIDFLALLAVVLGLICVVTSIRRRLHHRRQQNQYLSKTAKRNHNNQIETTLGQPLLNALRISDGALLEQIRLFSPEQRAAVAIWVLDPATRVQQKQRERLVAALRKAEESMELIS